MKTALITGAAGFVGRHLSVCLQRADYNVVGIDPKAFGGPCYRRGTFQEWIADSEGWGGHSAEVIVHLAANIESIDRRTAGGAEQFADCELDLAMMRYLERHPPKLYVHMTSCVVSYPEPTDPYCAVKTFGEAMARHVCKKAGIRLVLLRPFSGYGADQAESYPFPAILKRALNREDPLTVWGNGKQVRDFVHVDDIVRAILHGLDGGFPDGEPVEIGTGRPTTMGTLALLMAHAVGYDPQLHTDTSKPGGAPVRAMTSDLAAQHGFRAEITLEEGIRCALGEAGK